MNIYQKMMCLGLIFGSMLLCLKMIGDAQAGVIMSYQKDATVYDVYVDHAERRLMVVDRYKRQIIVEHRYDKAEIMKDEALRFYCQVKQPSFSDVFLCK